MTSYKSLDEQKGFADLRQQMREHLFGPVVPASEIGKLPVDSSDKVKRVTLHLDSFKNLNLKSAI